MQIESYIPIIVSIITAIAGPVILFFLTRMYTDKKIDQSQVKTDKKIDRITSELSEQFDSYLGNHNFMFNKLDVYIRTYITGKQEKEKLHLELKLIAVAMTYSWDYITEELSKLLEDFPSVSIDLKVAFVDCEHLKSLNKVMDTKEKDWAAISEEKTKKIPDFKNSMRRFGNRFTSEFRTYKNLPHWHGWLVSDKDNTTNSLKYLFLGRTKWEYTLRDGTQRKKPKLTVGQNEYRFLPRVCMQNIKK